MADVYRIGRPAGQWLNSSDPYRARRTFAEIAWHSQNRRASEREFADLLGPGESDKMRRAMVGLSTCGLAVRGWLRLWGVSHPRLRAPYQTGMAIIDCVTIFQQHGAWRFRVEGEPEPGHVLLVGEGQAAHICAVTAIQRTGGLTRVETCDGGQVCPHTGDQMIRIRTREWRRVGGSFLLGDRIVYGLGDPGALRAAANLPWMLPPTPGVVSSHETFDGDQVGYG